MKNILPFILFNLFFFQAYSQNHQLDPPWNPKLESKVNFTVNGIDNVPDLYGDIVNPQLVVFFAGNQFMCVDDLLNAFKKKYPQYQRIFVETLPPGVLAEQLVKGSLVVGNLRIDLKPDIFTDGKGGLQSLMPYFSMAKPYAKNKLALLVQKGNPLQITGLRDLGRKTVRISMPNPQWEGIGKLIEKAYQKAGGDELQKKIMVQKVSDSSTFLTQIHHRESPMRIMYHESDVAPVWYSEAYYQEILGHPTSLIEIPDPENMSSEYWAGQLKNAPHPEAARDFLNFLTSAEAKSIYKKFGFMVD